MKLALAAVLGGSLGVAVAQQAPNAVTLPGQSNPVRPGGISFVTRPTSTLRNVNSANALFAAAGVPVLAAPGSAANSTVSGLATAPVLAAAAVPLDERSTRALQMLAARGDPTARRILAGATSVTAAPASR